jgi:bacterioferritin
MVCTSRPTNSEGWGHAEFLTDRILLLDGLPNY